MEQLNRIELVGVVGCMHHSKVGDRTLSRFTVATNLAFKDRDGDMVIETTWHSVSAFSRWYENSLEHIVKGDGVHVVGRLRINRCTGTDGTERTSAEVIAMKVEKISKGEKLQMEIG